MTERGYEELVDKPKAECGVVAVYSPDLDAAGLACKAISELSYRGHEMVGVGSDMGDSILVTTGLGTGHKVFPDGGTGYSLAFPTHMAFAQARYSTQGTQELSGAQPHERSKEVNGQPITVAHVENGNLTNTHALANKYGLAESDYVSDNDLMAHIFLVEIEKLLLKEPEKPVDPIELVQSVVPQFEGAFIGILMHGGKTIVYSDHNGFKPAVLGQRPNGGIVVASEITALEAVDATLVRDIAPAEMIVIEDGDWYALQWAIPGRKRCLIEMLYVMKPTTKAGTAARFNDMSILDVRTDAGRAQGKRTDINADIAFGVPNSGIPVGRGFSEASGIPLDEKALTANKELRSFIDPIQRQREEIVRDKLIPSTKLLKDQKTVGCEDTVIRGSTVKTNSKMMREAGVAEYHMVVGAPMIMYTCDLGIDLGISHELLAHRAAEELGIDLSQGYDSLTSEQIAAMNENMREYLGVDSLTFLTPDQMREVLGSQADEFCMQCMTGDYPDLKAVPVHINDREKNHTTDVV